MKTLLLENDNYFWEGQEEWCKSFDPNFIKIHTDTKKDWLFGDSMRLCAILSQPQVEDVLVCTAFESPSSLSFLRRHDHQDEHYQLEEFAEILLYALRVRERLKYSPLKLHVNYHGDDVFAEQLAHEKWGHECYKTVDLVVRQNVDNLTVNFYRNYEHQYVLTEEMLNNYREQYTPTE